MRFRSHAPIREPLEPTISWRVCRRWDGDAREPPSSREVESDEFGLVHSVHSDESSRIASATQCSPDRRSYVGELLFKMAGSFLCSRAQIESFILEEVAVASVDTCEKERYASQERLTV